MFRTRSSARSEPHCLFGGLQECLQLVEGFLVFGLGVAVGDDAAAGLQHEGSVLQHGGAQRDAGVHGTRAAEIADGAAIDVAAFGLQLVEDRKSTRLNSSHSSISYA